MKVTEHGYHSCSVYINKVIHKQDNWPINQHCRPEHRLCTYLFKQFLLEVKKNNTEWTEKGPEYGPENYIANDVFFINRKLRKMYHHHHWNQGKLHTWKLCTLNIKRTQPVTKVFKYKMRIPILSIFEESSQFVDINIHMEVNLIAFKLSIYDNTIIEVKKWNPQKIISRAITKLNFGNRKFQRGAWIGFFFFQFLKRTRP